MNLTFSIALNLTAFNMRARTISLVKKGVNFFP